MGSQGIDYFRLRSAGNDLTRMEEDSITAIRAVEPNTATSRPVGQLYAVKDAYEYLLNADTTHYKNLCIADRSTLSAFCKLHTDKGVEARSASAEEWVFVDDSVV